MHPQHFRRTLLIAAVACSMVVATASSVVGGPQQPVAASICPDGVCPSPIQSKSDHHRSVVRVVNAQTGSRSFGSGTLLDKNDRHGLVLTCAHLFREGVGTVSVVFQDGHTYGARVLKLDRAWDLAALLIYAPEAGAVRLADNPPAPGDALSSCGYGHDGRFWCNRGRALQYVVASGTASAETLEISGTARQGDSGGPIINARGELVGVVLATNGRVVVGTCCKRIRRFLAGLSPRFSPPARPPHVAEGAPPPSKVAPDRLSALVDRLDQMRQGIQSLEGNLKQARETFETRDSSLAEKVDRLSGLAGALTERVGKAESGVSKSRLRTLLHDMVVEVGIDRQIGLDGLLWPVVAGSLGLSAPPVIALFAWKVLRAIYRRRNRDRRRRRPVAKDGAGRRRAHTGNGPSASAKLNDDYGRQLLEVFAQSGRSPVQDATLGREYDEEIRNAEQSTDPKLARWAGRLRDKVERKFHRIHGLSPAPAEPLEESDGSATSNPPVYEGEN